MGGQNRIGEKRSVHRGKHSDEEHLRGGKVHTPCAESWRRRGESNPELRLDKPPCCRYTTPPDARGRRAPDGELTREANARNSHTGLEYRCQGEGSSSVSPYDRKARRDEGNALIVCTSTTGQLRTHRSRIRPRPGGFERGSGWAVHQDHGQEDDTRRVSFTRVSNFETSERGL